MPPLLFLAFAILAPLPALAADDGCGALPRSQADTCRAMSAQHAPDCAAVARAPDRLACWDRLYRLVNCPALDGPVEVSRCATRGPLSLTEVEAVSASGAAAPWRLETEVSAFSDRTSVFLSVPSDAPVSCGLRGRASLILRCLDDRTAAYVIHDCATPRIGDEGWSVDLALDDGPADRDRMIPTQRGDGFGHFDYRAARTLIEALEGAEALHLGFSDIEGFRAEARFPLTGLSTKIGVLKTTCGWSDIPPWAREEGRPLQDGGPN